MYNIDLGWAIVTKSLNGCNYKTISNHLMTSTRTIQKVLENYNNTNVPPKTICRKPRCDKRLKPLHLCVLEAILFGMPELYLDELRQELFNLTGACVSQTTLHRALKEMGMVRRRIHYHGIPNPVRAAQFDLDITSIKHDRLVWVDECGFERNVCKRRYGRGPATDIIYLPGIYLSGHRRSLVGAMSVRGIIASHISADNTNKENFNSFALQTMLPQLTGDETIILDNSSTHKGTWIDVYQALGIRVLFLPPYSPELNPIEPVWNKVKHQLKRSAPLLEALGWSIEDMIDDAIKTVTPTDCKNFARHCGYQIE